MLSRTLAKGIQAAARKQLVSTSTRGMASASDAILIRRMFTQPNKYIFYTLTGLSMAGFVYGQIMDSFGKKTYMDVKERFDREVAEGKRNSNYSINKDFYLSK